MARKRSFFQRNGLSIVLITLLVVFLTGQALTGWHEHNGERAEESQPELTLSRYLASPHFRAATFENWESEFLQMAMYVMFTVGLYQVGSSESKDPDKVEEVDRKPKAHPKAPWPVRKGGWVLAVYKRSLSLLFILLFLISFALHLNGSYALYEEEALAKGQAVESFGSYITGSRFWFESFQNWQSEFLAVACIVLFSIWFRQQGSPESKPVDAPYDETGS